MARADFDGDGKEDMAELLINDKENKLGLFVKLSNQLQAETIMLEEFDDKRWIEVIGIAVAKSGEYRTACGKGYFDCCEGEPEILVLKLPAINLFKLGSANSFFIWDEKAHHFKLTCPPNLGPDVKLESGLNTGGLHGQEILQTRADYQASS